MISRKTKNFNKLFLKLPKSIKVLAIKNYKIWKENHLHPSINYKKLNNLLRSVRIGEHYRAMAYIEDNNINWFWIGSHEEYNNLIQQINKKSGD